MAVHLLEKIGFIMIFLCNIGQTSAPQAAAWEMRASFPRTDLRSCLFIAAKARMEYGEHGECFFRERTNRILLQHETKRKQMSCSEVTLTLKTSVGPASLHEQPNTGSGRKRRALWVNANTNAHRK